LTYVGGGLSKSAFAVLDFATDSIWGGVAGIVGPQGNVLFGSGSNYVTIGGALDGLIVGYGNEDNGEGLFRLWG